MELRLVTNAWSNIRAALPKNVLLDLMDAWTTDLLRLAKAQSELGLSGTRKRQSFGLARHFKWDQTFEEVAANHGGIKLDHVVIDPGQGQTGKERALHLTTYAFSKIAVGFASHRADRDLPRKTITRGILASANRGIDQPDFFCGGRPTEYDFYVTVMAQVDPSDLTNLKNISLALIDPSQGRFIDVFPLVEFIEQYAPSSPQKPLVGGVKRVLPFRHPGGKKSDEESR